MTGCYSANATLRINFTILRTSRRLRVEFSEQRAAGSGHRAAGRGQGSGVRAAGLVERVALGGFTVPPLEGGPPNGRPLDAVERSQRDRFHPPTLGASARQARLYWELRRGKPGYTGG